MEKGLRLSFDFQSDRQIFSDPHRSVEAIKAHVVGLANAFEVDALSSAAAVVGALVYSPGQLVGVLEVVGVAWLVLLLGSEVHDFNVELLVRSQSSSFGQVRHV